MLRPKLRQFSVIAGRNVSPNGNNVYAPVRADLNRRNLEAKPGHGLDSPGNVSLTESGGAATHGSRRSQLMNGRRRADRVSKIIEILARHFTQRAKASDRVFSAIPYRIRQRLTLRAIDAPAFDRMGRFRLAALNAA